MHMPCIYRVFGKEYDEDDPEQTRRTGQISNNSVKCPLCNQKTRLRHVVRLYLQDGGLEGDDEREGDEEQDVTLGLDGVARANEHDRARIQELSTMLTSARRRLQGEQKEKMRLAQVNEELAAQLEELATTSKRRLDKTREERDHALRERKLYEKKAANLQVEMDKMRQELDGERAYSLRQAVALDDGLVGERLSRKLRDAGNAKDWVYETLEARNQKILSLMNGMERLERENRMLMVEKAEAERQGAAIDRDGRQAPEILSRIENVPFLTGKRSGPEGGMVRRSLPSAASKPASARDQRSASRDKRKPGAEEDVVVLLDDEVDLEMDLEVENALGDLAAAVGSSRFKPVATSFAMAGPSRDTLDTAPGPSFIKRSAMSKASTGLDNPGKFIQRYPDGRGGWQVTYTGKGGNGGGGAAKKKKTSAERQGDGRSADISRFFQKR